MRLSIGVKELNTTTCQKSKNQTQKEYEDLDGKNDGVCTNHAIPDDKPQGSGDIDQSKDDKGNNNGDGNNNGSNKDLQDIKR